MMDSTQLATTISVSISTGVIVACVMLVGTLYRDISQLHHDAVQHMHHFNALTNDAWTDVMTMQADFDVRTDHNSFTIAQMFRPKRQSSDGLPKNFNCGLQPSKCPEGPVGPPGDDGINGEDGEPGSAGQRGISGLMVAYGDGERDCIVCPQGIRGPIGLMGPLGVQGPRGRDGPPGAKASSGEPGSSGPHGDQGTTGVAGEVGVSGEQGKAGVSAKPGHKGMKGPRGLQGPVGLSGQPGTSQDGELGLIGQRGPHWLPGTPGLGGTAGSLGTPGIPGSDGSYCPCPPREEAVSDVFEPITQFEDSSNPDSIHTVDTFEIIPV